ncbi:MAG: hypothetical protein U5K76_04620 [Woeseiaceae bacterium]|nr:hypothetical protein [Woeseiaceae bacterium]
MRPVVIRHCVLALLLSAGSWGQASPQPPAAAGSLGPSLAAGADGAVVLSWLEPSGDGHALRFASWRDGSWQSPGTVTSGDGWFVNWADFPSVTPIDGAFWVAHWLVRRPAGGYAYDVHTAVSTDSGATWSAALRPHRDDTDSEHGFVSVFPYQGDAGLIWLDGRYTVPGRREPGGMTLRAASLTAGREFRDRAEIDGLVCDCCQTDVAATPAGPVAVYRDRTPGEIRDVYVTRLRDGAWTPGTPVARDGWRIDACPVNGPVIRSLAGALAVAWFSAAGDVPRVRLARSPTPDAPFEEPVAVFSGDTIGRVGLVLLADGTAVVSALERSDAGLANLRIAVVGAGGTPGPAHTVVEGVPQFSVPQIATIADGLLVVWTSQSGGSTRLQSKRVPVAALR